MYAHHLRRTVPPKGRCGLEKCITVSLTHTPPDVVRLMMSSLTACRAATRDETRASAGAGATYTAHRTVDDEKMYSASGCGLLVTNWMAWSMDRTATTGSSGPNISSCEGETSRQQGDTQQLTHMHSSATSMIGFEPSTFLRIVGAMYNESASEPPPTTI